MPSQPSIHNFFTQPPLSCETSVSHMTKCVLSVTLFLRQSIHSLAADQTLYEITMSVERTPNLPEFFHSAASTGWKDGWKECSGKFNHGLDDTTRQRDMSHSLS